MNIFLAPDAGINALVVLDETESHHAIQVLRMKKDDAIHVFDGTGNLYNGIIAEANKKQVTVSIQNHIVYKEQKSLLHIAIAPTKQMERFEWFVEKAVEIGVGAISPIICHRSERKDLKLERLQKLIVTACKQSKNFHLPVIHPAQKFTDFIQTNLPETRCLAWCETNTTHFKNVVQPGKALVCMIGPEGDFTKEEISMSEAKNFQAVSFGNSILRSETAGVYLAAVYQSLQ